MSATVEAREEGRGTALSRLRAALQERKGAGRVTVLVVAALFLALALLDGGTEPSTRAFAALGLWLAVIVGLVLAIWPRAPVPRPALICGVLLGALAILSGLSLSWANDNGAAFSETIRVLTYLGVFVCVLLASSPGSADRWLMGIGLGIGAVGLLAIVGRTQPGLIGAAEEVRAAFTPAERRLSWPTAYWNGLGVLMTMGILLYTWLAAEGRTARVRVAAAAAIPVAALVLLMTSSRGALVALAVGMVLLVALGRSRSAMTGAAALGAVWSLALVVVAALLAPSIVLGRLEVAAAPGEGDLLLALALLVAACAAVAHRLTQPALTRLRVPRWAVVVLLAGAGIVLLAGVVAVNPVARAADICEPSRNAQGVGAHLTSSSGSGRCQYWSVGFDAFRSAPVFGIGAGGFKDYWGEHHTQPRPVTFAHSIVVGSLAELGLVGFLLVAGFLAVAVAAGVKARKRITSGSVPAVALAVVAAGGVAATLDWMWEFPSAIVPLLIGCALMAGPALSRVPSAPRGRFGFGVAALLVGWLTMVAAVLSFFGESRINAAEEALAAGELDASIEQSDTASTVLPWDAEPYLLRAAALEGQGDLDAAAEAVDAALERSPGDWEVWAVAARIYEAAGRTEEAREASRLATRLNPSTGREQFDS